ncbi:MAG: aromatic ring-hydroxylating dioxygenase subunit alpha [Xanthobacteraceae bacterium]|nr:aromatic ring-hydroxylating dioxygenase subunit alpha [Xanthobacteraceae bacterium]
MKYVKEAWYPVVWADRVGRELTRHVVHGEPIVIYRLENGTIAALQDACPHRLAPLSLGKLKGDHIECGYHGMTFDCSGKCVLIPGQDIIPGSALVRAYPLQVKYGLVWLYMGDAKNADPKKIFDLPQYDQEGWHAVQGDTLRIECNYLSLCDNLLDPAHVTFVHTTTLGTPAGATVPVNNEYRNNEITVWRWIRNGPPIPLFAKFGKMSGMVDRWHYYNYSTPCYFAIDMGSCVTGSIPDTEQRHEGVQMYACHVLTPVDERTVLQHWFHVRNFRTDENDMDAELTASLDMAFKEDKVILERIQLEEERDPDFKRIILGIDAAPMKMRRMVDKLIEQETDAAHAARR